MGDLEQRLPYGPARFGDGAGLDRVVGGGAERVAQGWVRAGRRGRRRDTDHRRRAQPRRTSSLPVADRLRPRPLPLAVDTDVPAMVRALLAGPDVAPTRAPATTTLRAVAAAAAHLSGYQAQLLARAIDRGGAAVLIDYVNAQGRSSRRVIEAPVLDSNLVIAWGRLREHEWVFNLGRIITVAPATGLEDPISPSQDHLDLFLTV